MGKSKSSSDDVSSGSDPDLLKKSANDDSASAIATWLNFLQMQDYLADFIDNGYDDLETAKKIGSEDLEAIGVEDPHHKVFLLDAVRVLREQGAAWVYLLGTCHPNQAEFTGQGDAGDRASAGSSGIASLPWTDQDNSSSGDNSTCSSSRLKSRKTVAKPSQPATKCLVQVTPEHQRVSSPESGVRRLEKSRLMISNFEDEQLDLIQRVSDTGISSRSSRVSSFLKKPPLNHCDKDYLQLNLLVKDKLYREGLCLAAPPFTTKVS